MNASLDASREGHFVRALGVAQVPHWEQRPPTISSVRKVTPRHLLFSRPSCVLLSSAVTVLLVMGLQYKPVTEIINIARITLGQFGSLQVQLSFYILASFSFAV